MPYAGTTVHTIPPDRRLRRRGTIGRTTTQHARSTLVHVSLHARAGVAHSTVPHFPVHRSPRLRHPGLRTSRSRPGGRPGLTCYMFTFMYRTVVPHLTSYDLSCCVVRNPAKSVERKLLSLLPRARAWRAPRRGCAFDVAPVGPLCGMCFIYGVRVPLRSASPTMC